MSGPSLARPFTGVVVHGDGKGRTIGYPTANLIVEPASADEEQPPHGVYATTAEVARKAQDGEERKTETFPAMTFVGRKSASLGNDKNVLVESYLFDFDGDLYGQTMTVSFKHFIREDQKVDSFAELLELLKSDEDKSRALLGLPPAPPKSD
eukprot:TRINITY_DN113615_c0_g1_i1.p1 TRINITY_DN113615_c0_g1~~TRINITY_DN113615_c0_g1_i1.p1  ORF type:complete len:152 (-),score=7.19 TRINITY_DN113615_c0_g1_i1:226-681(-)